MKSRMTVARLRCKYLGYSWFDIQEEIWIVRLQNLLKFASSAGILKDDYSSRTQQLKSIRSCAVGPPECTKWSDYVYKAVPFQKRFPALDSMNETRQYQKHIWVMFSVSSNNVANK
ncbi:uncharacterized protein LOC126758449 isoform X2 [Bactrocera neohumeralis]|uniref:uncharacterized protein LOC126758449 isoform X2 n=1 Tax=Bactrocera neohumeralis TaxID=98809 RepID=UPI0021652003|nr:uncharacterized protein LOC126758449 isoform X2 [Bactrocera neohumeralis]